MKKILFILAALIFSSFSLSAQWACKTLDPEFDNALKIAYTEMNNRAQLIMGEFMPIKDYNYWCSYYERDEEIISKSITRISNGSYSGDEVMDFFNELDDNAFSNASMVSCLSEIKGRQDKELGNVPLMLAVDHYWELQAPYRFEISLKVGTGYNNYKSGIDFEVAYEWVGNKRVGHYYIEWLSRDFWRDFRAANSVKIRIKQNRDSDYQYYEFSMSGSSNAFKYVTIGHEVIWVEDLAECFIKVFEVMKTKEEQKEAERQRVEEEVQMEEAELEKKIANFTPPHELKFECTERSLRLIYPDFYLYSLSDSVSCGTFEYSYEEEENIRYDTILNIMGLCPCSKEAIETIEDDYYYSGMNKYSKKCCWELDGIHIWRGDKYERDKDKWVREGEIVVPFKDISRYDWGGRYCAVPNWGDNSYISGYWLTDTITKYQITWTQNPLKLIVSEKNRTKEYAVVDWSADKEWESGGWRYYVWSYNLLSDNGERYNVYIQREITDPKSWGANYPMWSTNIGQVLLFDHWQIPSNIFFRHTTIQDEEDYLEIIK